MNRAPVYYHMQPELLYWLIGTAITVTVAVFGIRFLFINKKFSVLQLARETKIDAQNLAKEVAERNEKVVIDIKDDMKSHISTLISTLKQDIELQRTLIYSKIEILGLKQQQDKIDLLEHIQDEKDELTRMQKSIEFLQTMAWGPDSKSVPDYMFGKEESQEHKDEPSKGAFRDRPEGGGEEEKQTKENEERIRRGGRMNNG